MELYYFLKKIFAFKLQKTHKIKHKNIKKKKRLILEGEINY